MTIGEGATMGDGIKSVTQFLKEVRYELKRVTWPSRKETIAGTIVVLVIALIAAAFLGIVDQGLAALIRLVLSD